MSLLIQTLIRGVAIPAMVAAVALILGRIVPTHWREPVRSFGLGVGLILSYILLAGWPAWPWSGSPSTVFVAGIVACLWPWVERGVQSRLWFKRYLLVAMLGFLALKPFVTSLWPTATSLYTVIMVATAVVFIWFAVDQGSLQMTTAGSGSVFLVTGTGLSLYMLQQGNALLSQLVGAYCAIWGVVVVLSIFSALKVEEEFTSFAVVPLLSLVLCFHYYAESDWKSLAWLLAPLFLFVFRSVVRWQATPIADAISMAAISSLPVVYFFWPHFNL